MREMEHKEAKKKRIGILTFHCADSFGAMLQAYGLLTWLKEQGWDAFIINYVPPALRGREWFFPYIPDRKAILFSLERFIKNVCTGKYWWMRRRQMEEFRRKYLTHGSRAIYSFRGLSRVEADLLIVGSDQIWNPDVTLKFLPAYFGIYKNRRVKKTVAYAASLGTAFLPKKAEAEFSRLVASVYKISMREKSAAQYIEKRFRRRALHVCDPIFLLNADQWRALKDCPKERGFILYYELGYQESLRNAALQLAQEKNLKIIELAARKERHSWPFQVIYTAGPLQFLGYMDAAEYVFTNSFHALAFSILFHKQFYIENHVFAGARFESLLETIGQSGRPAAGECMSDIEENIDWEEVERRLEILRQQSKEFLYRSVKSL